MNQYVISLQLAILQLTAAIKDMADGDLLMARERLALVVAALDKVTYPNG